MGCRRPQQGFTLIEVVVAFAIFALAVGALYEILFGAVKRASATKRLSHDWLLAQSLLAEQTVRPFPWRDSQGTTEDGALWQLKITPLEAAYAASSEPWRLQQISVSVSRQGAKAPVTISSVEIERVESE
jgi:general secretion pathway protein I